MMRDLYKQSLLFYRSVDLDSISSLSMPRTLTEDQTLRRIEVETIPVVDLSVAFVEEACAEE